MLGGEPMLNTELFKIRSRLLTRKTKKKIKITHHHGRTILVEIPGFDLGRHVVVDIMHLYYNIVKGLMLKFIGRYGHLPKDDREFVAKKLDKLERPEEFARKPRRFFVLSSWKATELRQFLLYTGPVILKGYLPVAEYENFLSLCVAIRLLNDDRFYEDDSELPEFVKKLIRYFLSSSADLYGVEFVTLAVHMILHLPDDCLEFGKPETFSCFPHEDKNYKLGLSVASGKKPWEQVRNRYEEAIFSKIYAEPPHWTKRGSGTVLLRPCKLQKGNLIFSSNKEGDRFCSVKRSSPSRWPIFVQIHSFSQEENDIIITGKKFKFISIYFISPCSSEEVDIYECGTLSSSLISFKAEEIEKKYYAIPLDHEKMVLIGLLHV